ncbi:MULTISPECIES: MFS transporter [Micrococcaceae]|jgi:MFS family permease|uniref:MFS transporter n=1 Tax=Micrococcaceae TaxID=1268 RepID=UPI0006FECF56|nr:MULTISPECIES: MFS transporter [Micrococcaceae]KRE77799.1 MFS transporter [Arthrobacter sp. Soil761]MBD1591152.1 MFS transporter [Arthrobacter sp. S1_S22]TQJ60741.1 MFS transporter [Arthrobacter sp. SLBN-83]TWD56815.1 MFS transporter [Arthrobacter sp. AG367]
MVVSDSAAGPEAPNSLSYAPVPVEKAQASVITTMVLARLGLMIALFMPIVAGMTLKVQSLVPGPDVAATLGTVISMGAFAALLFDPVFGRLSDRTVGRFGRRRPWLVAGALGLLACLAVIATAPNAVVLGIGWFFAQALGNAAVAAHTATLADQVPQWQRGKVSGMIGIASQAASLGAAYSASLFGQNMLLLFLVPGVLALVLVLVFAFVLPDRPMERRPASEGGLRTALKTFWVNPRKNPDFAFAWVSRFLVVLAMFMFVTFRLLYLQQDLGLSKQDAAGALATGVLIYTLALVTAGQIAGWISDRLGRRKVFIWTSAIIFGIGTWMLTAADSTSGFYWAELVIGIGFGIYIAVDLALVIDVLPNPDDTAKDLGVFNIAMTGPQTLAPAVSAALVTMGGGRYDLLLAVAAGIALLGALTILPVKKVR